MKPHTPLVIGLLVVGAAGLFFVRRRAGEGAPVDVGAPARRASFQSFVTASGEIVATRYADIGSSVMGRLVELKVAEGDAVRAGQVLARIDPVQAESEVKAFAAALQALLAEGRSAEARDREARQEHERAAALREQGLLPQSEFDRTEAAAAAARAQAGSAAERVAQAEAQLRRVRDQLSKTEISAPMSGVVTRLSAREGEMVVVGVQNQPGTILMTLSDLSAINAEVKVAEADVLRLKLGQKATVVLEAISGREFSGQVAELGASALPPIGAGAAAREFRVVVRLDQPDRTLRPGLTCDARILTEEVRDAVTVPLQAVVLRPDPAGGERSGVFVLDQGRVRFQPVTTGVIGGLDVEVKGLPEGVVVVVGPFQALRELQDGARARAKAPGR